MQKETVDGLFFVIKATLVALHAVLVTSIETVGVEVAEELVVVELTPSADRMHSHAAVTSIGFGIFPKGEVE